MLLWHFFKLCGREASREHSVPWRRTLSSDNSRRYGAPSNVPTGVVRRAALTSSTILVFKWRILTCPGWNWWCHVIIVIKTDMSIFVAMHSGLCEQSVQSLDLTASGWISCPHAPSCTVKISPSRTSLNPLNNHKGALCLFHYTRDYSSVKIRHPSTSPYRAY